MSLQSQYITPQALARVLPEALADLEGWAAAVAPRTLWWAPAAATLMSQAAQHIRAACPFSLHTLPAPSFDLAQQGVTDADRWVAEVGLSVAQRAFDAAETTREVLINTPPSRLRFDSVLTFLEGAMATLECALPSSPREAYRFSNEWFVGGWAGGEWRRQTRGLRGRKIDVLEIGSFEGASTTWVLDELMLHPQSHTTAVDTFAGAIEHKEGNYDLETLEARFMANVRASSQFDRLTVQRQDSIQAAIELRAAHRLFDFIYLDGSHMACDVLHDAVTTWPMLKEGGIMAFDDYHWNAYPEDYKKPKIAVDGFLRCYAPQLAFREVSGYQMWVTKKVTH